ncbi:MAG: flavodoxin [Coriobacteriia bacterium]|nr:flavodoxin [Coriobacteriia bacterium]
MEPLISRRNFVSAAAACVAGALATGALAGCSAGESRTNANANANANQAANTNTNANAASNTANTANQSTTPAADGVAVVYFSATGNTRAQAEALAARLGVTAGEIVPAEPYSADDLNYNIEGCRANNESFDASARPAIGSAPSLTGVGTLYLGYPIWWGEAAAIMRTFVESVNLVGVKVVPFCTSGGSGIAGSGSTLKAIAGAGEWTTGMRLTGASGELDALLAQ